MEDKICHLCQQPITSIPDVLDDMYFHAVCFYYFRFPNVDKYLSYLRQNDETKCSCNWHTEEEAVANGIHPVTRKYCIGDQIYCKECGFEFNKSVNND